MPVYSTSTFKPNEPCTLSRIICIALQSLNDMFDIDWEMGNLPVSFVVGDSMILSSWSDYAPWPWWRWSAAAWVGVVEPTESLVSIYAITGSYIDFVCSASQGRTWSSLWYVLLLYDTVRSICKTINLLQLLTQYIHTTRHKYTLLRYIQAIRLYV